MRTIAATVFAIAVGLGQVAGAELTTLDRVMSVFSSVCVAAKGNNDLAGAKMTSLSDWTETPPPSTAVTVEGRAWLSEAGGVLLSTQVLVLKYPFGLVNGCIVAGEMAQGPLDTRLVTELGAEPFGENKGLQHQFRLRLAGNWFELISDRAAPPRDDFVALQLLDMPDTAMQ
jgi:hypothetical protein